MGSKKAILILGLLAMVLLISSEVGARDDLAEASPNSKKAEVVKETNEVNDAKYGGYPGGGGQYNGGYDPGHGGNYGGGGYPGNHGGRGHHGGGGHGGGYCRHGCCDRGYYGGCRRCCSYPGEVVAAQTEDHN